MRLWFLERPFIHEFDFNGPGIYQQNLPVRLSTGQVKPETRAILADIFINHNKNDHFVMWLSDKPCERTTPWASNGGKFGADFRKDISNSAMIVKDPLNQNSPWGQWISSVVIPTGMGY